MRKSDLKSGMLVFCKNRMRFFVVKDTGMENADDASDNVLVGIYDDDGSLGDGWMDLNEYEEDLTFKEDSDFDIVAVYKVDSAYRIGNFDYYKKLWIRE